MRDSEEIPVTVLNLFQTEKRSELWCYSGKLTDNKNKWKKQN